MIRASCRSDGRVDLADDADGLRRPVRPVRRARGRGRVRAARGALGGVHRALPRAAAATAPVDARPPLAGRPRPAGGVRGLQPVPRPRTARAVRARQPGAARRRPWAHRPAGTARERRTHPAGPAPRTRRHRRDRVRPGGPRGDAVEGERVDVVARLAAGRSAAWRRCSSRSVTSRRAGAHPRARRSSSVPRSQGARRSDPARPRREGGAGVTARPRPGAAPARVTGPGGPGLPAGVPIAAVLAVAGLFVIGIVTVRRGPRSDAVHGRGPAAAARAERRPGRSSGRRPRRTRSSCPTAPPGREVTDSRDAAVRQGRQHLDPDRRTGAAGDEGRQRRDADVLAGRQRDVLRPDPPGRRRLERRRRDARTTSWTCRRSCAIPVTAARRPRSWTGWSTPRQPEVGGLHPQAGRVRPPATRSPWRRTCPTRPGATSRSRSSTCATRRSRTSGSTRAPLGHQDPGWRPDGAAPRVRPRRPRRRQGNAPDVPLHDVDEEDAAR